MDLPSRIQLIDELIQEDNQATIRDYEEAVREISNVESAAHKDIKKEKLMEDLFGCEKMLALSWRQPYGTAMLARKNETRVWPTAHRGLVLICTSLEAYKDEELDAISGHENVRRMYKDMEPFADTLDLKGYAIAIGRLVNCRAMSPEDECTTYVKYREPWIEEREGKDGRIRSFPKRLYTHIYTDVHPIVPFKWKGAQGWTIVTEEIKKRIQYV